MARDPRKIKKRYIMGHRRVDTDTTHPEMTLSEDESCVELT